MRKFYLTYPVPTCGKDKNEQPHAGRMSIHDVTMSCVCHISAYSRTYGSLCHVLQILEMVFNGELEKESLIRVRMGQKNLSFGITNCHHSASLVMPIGDPMDIFFFSTLTLMIDSYIITQYRESPLFLRINFFVE